MLWVRAMKAKLVSLLLGLVLGHSSIAQANTAIQQASEDWIKEHGYQILNDFRDLLSMPNVASSQQDMITNANWIEDYIGQRGFSSEQVIVDGAPWIIAEKKVRGATKTILLYAHYDGQPVQAKNWATPPFEPTLRTGLVESGSDVLPWPDSNTPLDPSWRLFARSAGDDKAPVIGLMAALDALEAAGIAPTVNIKLILDGEEEAGSPTLARLLTNNAEKLDADLMLFCDGPMHQSRKRQLVFGVRGAHTVHITTYGPARPLHSGHYGNWAPNPNHDLVRALASLHDADGRITVDGFLDDVIAPTKTELEAIAAMPEVGRQLQKELQLGRTDLGGMRLEQTIMKPAIVVKGIDGGGAGPGKSRNIIQPSATASLNLRLVPGQTVEGVDKQLITHFSNMGYRVINEPPTVEQRLTNERVLYFDSRDGGYPAYRSAMDGQEAQTLATLLTELDGERPLLTPTMGGSLPIYLFDQYLDMPIIIFPIANHDNNQHGRNENMRLQNLWDAIAAYAVVLAEYGRN